MINCVLESLMEEILVAVALTFLCLAVVLLITKVCPALGKKILGN